jgi:uncharacterized protein
MASPRIGPGEVAWLPWSAGAFARARTERKPVLLCIATAWSESCRDMDRTSYADPAIAVLINDAFIPVRVDADRRPDVSERYSLGGWPTTAFLTPDGEVLGGGTYVARSRMPRVLDDVRAAFERGAPAPRAASPAGAVACPAGSPPDADVMCERVLAAYDDQHGGFGAAGKFPHTAPLHLAMARYRRSADARLETIVTTTLDAMGWGALYDEADGGFFRYAATRDWRQPHREKTLEVNAQLLRAYAEAADVFAIARFGERAADVVRYVQGFLADPLDGGWYGSQRAGDGVDTTLYADANAITASAMLRASALFDDASLRDVAIASLERVLLACYRPGHGVAHYFDGAPHVRGLLGDQITMAAAQLDAFDATGNVVYEMMAEELAHYAVREMWDTEGGGFFDRATAEDSEVGLMRVRLKPFVANCEAARALGRLAAVSGEADFARLGRAALAAVAPAAADQGPLAAHYVLACDQAE